MYTQSPRALGVPARYSLRAAWIPPPQARFEMRSASAGPPGVPARTAAHQQPVPVRILPVPAGFPPAAHLFLAYSAPADAAPQSPPAVYPPERPVNKHPESCRKCRASADTQALTRSVFYPLISSSAQGLKKPRRHLSGGCKNNTFKEPPPYKERLGYCIQYTPMQKGSQHGFAVRKNTARRAAPHQNRALHTNAARKKTGAKAAALLCAGAYRQPQSLSEIFDERRKAVFTPAPSCARRSERRRYPQAHPAACAS